jgi:ABC-2 type transport system permease protein
MLFDQQTRAIVWAQYRSIFNRFPRNRGGAVLAWFFSILWYAIFAFLGLLAALLLPEVTDRSILSKSLDLGLLGALMFWQLMPLMMATSGISLDLKRLLVYPIPGRRMFGIEVLLRASTGIEVLLVMTGAAIGLWRNPIVPWWGPLWFIPFTAFNLCLSAGIRDLLTRLLRRRGMREVVVLGMLLLTQVPNFLVRTIPPAKIAAFLKNYSAFSAVLPLPWQWTARLASGQLSATAFFGLALWLFLGAWFGYAQFRRGLRFDAAEAESAGRQPTGTPGRLSFGERVARLPLRFLPEPLATLVQKELLTLPRVPRFRTLFLMGAFFSLLIWLPYLSKPGGAPSTGFMPQNFLTIVVLYSMLLLTEPLFANVFAYDRKAAQAYFVMPVRFSTVLIAKNATALLFMTLEIIVVCLLAKIFRAPMTLQRLGESLATVFVFAAFLFAVGNLTSVRFAKGVDSTNPWRGRGSGRAGGWLMLVYVAAMPSVVIAHMAKYAFQNELAFFAVQASALFVALLTYSVTFGQAVEWADRQREEFLSALGATEGIIS